MNKRLKLTWMEAKAIVWNPNAYDTATVKAAVVLMTKGKIRNTVINH